MKEISVIDNISSIRIVEARVGSKLRPSAPKLGSADFASFRIILKLEIFALVEMATSVNEAYRHHRVLSLSLEPLF